MSLSPHRNTDITWGKSELKSLEPPTLARNLAWLVLAALLMGIAVLVWMPWQQNVRGSGTVIAFSPLDRRQDIEAPIKGRIKAWYVQEGSEVKKGDLIAVIQDNDPDYFQRLKRQRETLINQLSFNQAKVMSYELRVQDFGTVLSATLNSSRAKVSAVKAKLDLAERELQVAQAEQVTTELNIDRETQLRERGLSSQRSFEVATMKFRQSIAKVKKSKAKIRAVQSELRQAKAELKKAQASSKAKQNSAKANLNEAQASVSKNQASLIKLDTGLARQANQEIRAPRDGVILKLNTFSDTVYIKAGKKLATLVPHSKDRAVELYLTGNDIPLVSEGREVRLQFEGWPALQFSGWPTAAVGTFEGRVALVDVTDTKEGKFRVVVKPYMKDEGLKDHWPPSPYLRQGAQVKGWILLDTVPLGYELWRQFNGFPPRLSIEKPKSEQLIKRKTKK